MSFIPVSIGNADRSVLGIGADTAMLEQIFQSRKFGDRTAVLSQTPQGFAPHAYVLAQLVGGSRPDRCFP